MTVHLLNHVVVNQTSTYITALFFFAQPGLSAKGVVGDLIYLKNTKTNMDLAKLSPCPGAQIFVGPSSMAERFSFVPKFNGKKFIEYELTQRRYENIKINR